MRVTTYHIMTTQDFLCHLETIFREVDRHLPSFPYNACGECRVCCTAKARLGVSELEFEYIGIYLRSMGRNTRELIDFREYIQKKGNEKRSCQEHISIGNAMGVDPDMTEVNQLMQAPEKGLKFDECPLYDERLKGCSIYPARPLPCRTYGYFMNSKTISLIPDFCALKPTTVLYDEYTFFQHLPFCVPFFSLVFSYDDFRKREQRHDDGKQEQI